MQGPLQPNTRLRLNARLRSNARKYLGTILLFKDCRELNNASWFLTFTHRLLFSSTQLMQESMTDSKASKNDPFSLAKEALRYVSQFGTPPTPKIYETWYRYVVGADEDLVAHMDHAVNEVKSVSREWMEATHAQFCSEHDSRPGVAQSLASEIESIQSLVSKQKAAGTEFEGSIDAASHLLNSSGATNENVAACIAQLDGGAQKMKLQLMEMEEKLNQKQEQVAALQSELAASQRAMMTDHLTEVGNQRFFDSVVRMAIQDKDSHQDCVYLALIDMDRFKQINDTFGHETGDKLIKGIAAGMTMLVPSAAIARLGGDEFGLILRVNNRDEAVQSTERIREHFAGQRFALKQDKQDLGQVTFSMGLALLRNTDDQTSWRTRADKLLYNAKELGRNRAVIEK